MNHHGNYRTTNQNFSVVRVGDELTKCLGDYGFNVNHNKDFHDYPAYTGSYKRSLSTVQNILNNFNSDIIIDLHRDAIGSNENYAPLMNNIAYKISSEGIEFKTYDRNLYRKLQESLMNAGFSSKKIVEIRDKKF